MMPSLRSAVGQSYNEPDIAGSSDFPQTREAILPEIILPVSKQKCYNCAGMQEPKAWSNGGSKCQN